MVKKHDIDYEEIDRILKTMFMKLDNEIPEYQETNAFLGTNVEVIKFFLINQIYLFRYLFI